MALRTITFVLDDDDHAAFQKQVAYYQTRYRVKNEETGKTEPLLPEGDSDLLGAIVGEAMRDLDEYRTLYVSREADDEGEEWKNHDGDDHGPI